MKAGDKVIYMGGSAIRGLEKGKEYKVFDQNIRIAGNTIYSLNGNPVTEGMYQSDRDILMDCGNFWRTEPKRDLSNVPLNELAVMINAKYEHFSEKVGEK